MPDAEEKIEKIGKITRAARPDTDSLVDTQQFDRMAPNKDHFDSLVKTTQQVGAVEEKIEPVTKSSLMDEVKNLNQQVDHFSRINPSELIAQVDKVVNRIDTIKQKLREPDLKLNPATQNILQNKLSHIDENLRVALSKAGLEYAPSDHLDNKKINPLERFIGFLTHGQAQMASMSQEVEKMHLNGKDISPANMLRMQLKVNYVSQEIEFFIAVLNKALDSTKTIMNVQV